MLDMSLTLAERLSIRLPALIVWFHEVAITSSVEICHSYSSFLLTIDVALMLSVSCFGPDIFGPLIEVCFYFSERSLLNHLCQVVCAVSIVGDCKTVF